MFAILITSAAGAAMCLSLGLVLRLSSRVSAADRHENLSLAVALALLMPLLVLAMPASLRLDLPARLAPRAALLDDTVAHGTVAAVSGPEPRESALSGGATQGLASVDGQSRTRDLDATTAALGVWALGTLFFAYRLARAARLAARVRRRARSWSDDDDVVLSSEVRVPMVTGLVRPSIILPQDAPQWTAEDLALTLLHERAHVARRDVPKQWAASLVCALYWFNPLAWIVARAMATDREHAVDAMVLEGGARASSYAALLLRVAVRADAGGILAPFHAPAVGRADLAQRVEAVLGSRPARASRLRRAAGAAAIVTAALAVACSQGSAPSPVASNAPPSAAGVEAPRAPARSIATPSAVMLARALGGVSTLDARQQAATEEMLDEWLVEDENVLRAHVIAMELPSGRIVAIGGRDRAAGATMGLERAYPPASTIKPLILAAALEAGVVKADDTIDGQGGSRELTSSNGKKHTMTDATPQGRMSLAKMLAVSSNVGAVKIGERLGTARLVGALDTAGLFLPVDGLLVAPASRPSVETSVWHDAVVSIGHDFSVNPLRLVAAYSAFASDGRVVTPRFRDESPRTTSLFVSPDTARTVKGMMEGVVAEGGTGSLARVDGIRIAGKTGTGDLDGGLLYASFVGIFPADAPRYVLLVGAETRTGYGGRTAAPRFAALVGRAFR